MRKRRATFQRLLLACAATLVLGLIPPLRALWWASLVFLLVTAGYAVMLRRWHINEQQRRHIVRPLHDDHVDQNHVDQNHVDQNHVEQDGEASGSAPRDEGFDVVLPQRAAR